jgi:hypothetical protein
MVSYREDPSPFLGLLVLLVYAAVMFGLCVAIVKGVNATRRWLKRRNGSSETPDE